MHHTTVVSGIRYCILFLISFVFLVTSCSTNAGSGKIDDVPGTFKQNPTYHLTLYNGLLYAGTERGLFYKSADPADKNWKSLGLGRASIHTFLVFSDQKMLASVGYEGSANSSTIAKTNDGGKTWLQYQNGYGGNKYKLIPTEMEQSAGNPETIYAGGGGFYVAKSTNKGNSWNLKTDSWESLGGLFLIKTDINNPNIVWAGGTRATFGARLIKSTDSGETWKEVPVSGASANVNDLLIKSDNSEVVVAGLAGASASFIRKSIDGGQNWKTVLEGFNTRTMAHSARNPETIYASGQNEAGTLFFAQSPDFGETWQQVTVPGVPSDISVNDMVSVLVNGQEVLYFGTDKGVYSYVFEK